MSELYRAVYTRCFSGNDFYGKIRTQDGQQIFATGGDMGLSGETLKLIETEIRRDVYSAGMRPYLGHAYRYFSGNGTSVLLQYRWLKQFETGGKEFGLTKALIGNFSCHPMEYLSADFFDEERFFFDYPDANGQPIQAFKQLHTFREGKVPPPFHAITQDDLFDFPALSFQQAGQYVVQSAYVAEQVSKAVSHLIKQFSLPEQQRQGIVVKGTVDQLRYLFAAIAYAFSERAAQKISFSIAFPPNGFSYNFATAALVGWDIADPDTAKANRMPANMVYIDDLPLNDSNAYYTAVTKFDDSHHTFINKFVKKNDDVYCHAALYNEYASYSLYGAALQAFIEGSEHLLSLNELYYKITLYTNAELYVKKFYGTVLQAANKAVPQSEADIDILIDIYETIARMISDEVVKEEAASVEQLNEQLKQDYITRFYNIFASMLSDKYLFCNRAAAKKPHDYFVELVAKREAWAFEIVHLLIQDDVVDTYTVSYQPDLFPNERRKSWEQIMYARLSFINDMLVWHQKDLSNNIARFVYHVFNHILQIEEPPERLEINDIVRKLQQHTAYKLFNSIFCETALTALSIATPGSYSDISALLGAYDLLEQMIISTVDEDKMSIKLLQNSLTEDYIKHGKEIFCSILTCKYPFCDRESAKNLSYIFNIIEKSDNNRAIEIARYLMQDNIIDKYTFSLLGNREGTRIIPQYHETVVYPYVSFVSELMKKTGKLLSDSMVHYICKSFNAALLQKYTLDMCTLYNHLFLHFEQKEGNAEKGIVHNITTYRDCGYIPYKMDTEPFKECMEKVFLYDFQQQLKLIGIGKASNNIKIDEARRYVERCINNGFSNAVILSLYCECLHVEDNQSMFYFAHAFKIFSAHTTCYPYLCDLAIDKLLQKITFSYRTSEKSDAHYLDLLRSFLVYIEQSTVPELADTTVWQSACERFDAHLDKIFKLPKWETDDKYTNEKSAVYKMVSYLLEHACCLPGISKLNLYNWLKSFKGYEDEVEAIIDVLEAYLEVSAYFRNCSQYYKEAIVNVISNKRWTGTIYQLILHLFEFDDYITSEIIRSSSGMTTIHNEFALYDLCNALYALYINNKQDAQYEKFLVSLEKVYPVICKNRKYKWDGSFYLLLVSLFDRNDQFITFVLKTMVNERNDDLCVFCDFCIDLYERYEQYKTSDDLAHIWKLTEAFCYAYRDSNHKPMYKKILTELMDIAQERPGISQIVQWLEPTADNYTDKRGFKR